eukprot:TRINITY_DN262_c0_g3_i2.p1 TRINITY_DN262_c0_g3~~TRINITY_DN262_c0_g3_i2.p1  ORF type:complete len:213 (-),score=86.60 TRINITY_DN262_c0_g3_i2:899-1537(-)
MDPSCVACFLVRLASGPAGNNNNSSSNGSAGCCVAVQAPVLWRLFREFESVTVPAVPIAAYSARLLERWSAEPHEAALACLLLDRLSRRYAWARCGARSVHRLFLASLLVATKLLRDTLRRDAVRALSRIGGVPPEELAALEEALLALLSFGVYVAPDELCAFCAAQQRRHAACSAFFLGTVPAEAVKEPPPGSVVGELLRLPGSPTAEEDL